HHRRAAVLAADTIIAFLHNAYLDTQLNPTISREPWERCENENFLIDAHIGLAVETDDEGVPSLKFLLPGGDELPLNIEVSRLCRRHCKNDPHRKLNIDPCVLTFAASRQQEPQYVVTDRKSTRLNSSHVSISYAVFCLKKKR